MAILYIFLIIDRIEKHHIKLIGKEETCLPTIKIKELPKKQYSEINPTDIIVIEDTSDTKQITVEQLQLFFSSDEKLQAIIDQMEREFAEIKKYIDDHLKDVIDKDEELETRLNNLFEDHERTKQQVGRIQEDLVDAQNNIVEIFKRLDGLDSEVSNIQQIIADHEKRIAKEEEISKDHEKRIFVLEKDNETNKGYISDLQTDLASFKTYVKNEIDRLDQKIDDMNRENHEYTDKMYDQIMLYIDYYHHIHEFPPNFDEPYKGDHMVARYIHPVGTIYESHDREFNPNKWFPGTWKFAGTGASMDKDGKRVVDYYTWIRIE